MFITYTQVARDVILSFNDKRTVIVETCLNQREVIDKTFVREGVAGQC
ncbi:MAG: hypothetical protein ACYC0V_08175 [Armatimonadota bacterium]